MVLKNNLHILYNARSLKKNASTCRLLFLSFTFCVPYRTHVLRTCLPINAQKVSHVYAAWPAMPIYVQYVLYYHVPSTTLYVLFYMITVNEWQLNQKLGFVYWKCRTLPIGDITYCIYSSTALKKELTLFKTSCCCSFRKNKSLD
jgi:hypothetical protein